MMKYLRGALVAVVTAVSFLGTTLYMESQSFNTPRAYTVQIYNVSGTGSAVIIAPGLVITAAHVTANANLLINGKPTKVLKSDENLDLALVAADVDCPCAPLGDIPAIGDKVVAVGTSLGILEYATPGTIQGYTNGLVFTDSPIVFGNSGGGLFAFQAGIWKLVGITVQMSAANLGFFSVPVFHMTRSVPIHTVIAFIHNDVPGK